MPLSGALTTALVQIIEDGEIVMKLCADLWCLITVAIVLSVNVAPSGVRAAESVDFKTLDQQTRKTLDQGIAFYHSIAIEGGYVYHYTLDLQEKWGEGRTDDQTIEVQPPGTPAVGMSFLRAYAVMKKPAFLEAAKDAAAALVRGQNELGGWGHTITFNRAKRRDVSFDDNQTQSAIRFLMALDQIVDDAELTTAIDKSLEMMLASQMEHGGWPHQYPKQGNYHDFATFNDNGINDCLSVMMDAYRYYKKEEHLDSIKHAGRFYIMSQLPPPQPGWAQQYNQYLQPAWARAFEPPAVCPQVSVRNVHALIDLYLYTSSGQYLEPIPDALRWLDECRLPNGSWARFVEIGTGNPLYYDRGRIRVDSTEELSLERRTGYGYESDLSGALQEARKRFEAVVKLGREKYLEMENQESSKSEIARSLTGMAERVAAIIESQDDAGRWIVKGDRYRQSVSGRTWDGEYEAKDRISSALFNANVAALCEFLELHHEYAKR